MKGFNRAGAFFIKSLASGFPAFLLILVFTVIVSLIGFILELFLPNFSSFVFLNPSDILAGRDLWTLVSHIFFHVNFWHLFVNMFSLFFIGSACESLIGKKRMIWFYLFAGILGGVVFVLAAWLGSITGAVSLFSSLDISGAGASGALFGLLGILAVLIPKKRIYLIA